MAVRDESLVADVASVTPDSSAPLVRTESLVADVASVTPDSAAPLVRTESLVVDAASASPDILRSRVRFFLGEVVVSTAADIAAAILDGGAIFGPGVTGTGAEGTTVSVALISAGDVYGPGVTISGAPTTVSVPLISAGDVFAPTTSTGGVSVTPGIVLAGDIFGPGIAPITTVSVPIISAGQVFAPTTTASVVLASGIVLAGDVFGPGVTAIGGPQSASVPLISAGQVFGPGVSGGAFTQSVPVPLISAGQAFAPDIATVNLSVSVPLISGGVLFGPTITTAGGVTPLAVGLISAGEVFSPRIASNRVGETGVIVGPGYTPGTAAPSTLTMQLYSPEAPVSSPKATLANSFARSFQGHFGDLGGGTVTLLQTDSDLALVDYDDWVRCFLEGVCVFTFIVERIVRKVVDEGEEARQVAVISGPGFGALAAESKLYPPFGTRPLRSADTRTFGFAGIAHDRSSWSSGPQALQAGNDPNGAWYADAPHGWPDQTAYWITHLPPGFEQVPGDGYFANTGVSPIGSFILPEPRTVRLFAATDNGGEVWIDETLIYSLAANPEPSGWDQTQAYDLDLDAGEHFLAMKLTNFGPFEGYNPGAIILSIYTLSPGGGDLEDVVINTNGSASWRYLDRPAAVPGSTPGRIMRQVLAESDARGTTYVTPDFTDASDSRGAAWAAKTDTSIQVGTNGMAILQELAETYCDFDFDPDFPVLHLYNSGTGGTDRSGSVVLSAGVNLNELTVDGSSKGRANVLLIRYGKGYAEVKNQASVNAHGRREEFLQLGQQPTIAQVEAIGQALFGRIAEHQVSISASVIPTGPVGFLDYFPGDLVTCDGESGPSTVRVVAITVTEDVNGVVRTVPELNTLKEENAMNLVRQVNRMVPGALGGSR